MESSIYTGDNNRRPQHTSPYGEDAHSIDMQPVSPSGGQTIASQTHPYLQLLMDSAQPAPNPLSTEEQSTPSHPKEFVVTGTRVGVDGTYRKTSLRVEGVPLYSRLGDMAYMAVQDGRWVLWGGSDKKMVRSSSSHDGKTPGEMKSWEELKELQCSSDAVGDDMTVARMEFLQRIRIRVFEVPELSSVPPNIRAGPWSPVAVYSIALLGIGIGVLSSFAAPHYPFTETSADVSYESIKPWGGIWRTLLGVYCVIIYVVKLAATKDPLQRLISATSFTMCCWKVLTLRLLVAGLSAWFTFLERPAEILRFPALCGASVTVGIWWAAIVPVAICILFKTKAQRKEFMLLQSDFFLIHVHALNIIFASLDHAGIGGGGRDLTPADFLLASVLGMAYLCVYLSYHDPRGYHIYLVLSPRLHTCGFVYFFMFGLFYAFFELWKTVHP